MRSRTERTSVRREWSRIVNITAVTHQKGLDTLINTVSIGSRYRSYIWPPKKHGWIFGWCKKIFPLSKVSGPTSWFRTFALFWMLYTFFWVISRRLNFICRRFGTSCLFHFHRRIVMKNDWGWGCWAIYTGKCLARKFLNQTYSSPYKYLNILKPSHPSHLTSYEDGTECSETSAYKIQTPGNYPEENMQH